MISDSGTRMTDTIRLNKRMADLGLCSRREADDWIANGWVRVNGLVAQMGQPVTPADDIRVERAAAQAQAQRVTIVLNKPIGYVSGQAEDGHEPAATLIQAKNRWGGSNSKLRFSPTHHRGLAPAGRLDIDSTGLLVLTQDGRIARQLIGEDSDVEKEYLVRVEYPLQAKTTLTKDVQTTFPRELLAKLRHGLSLDGQALKPAQVDWQNPEQLRFVLKEGKKRQIRRMCEMVGLRVVALKRVRVGRVVLGHLPMGQWRYLEPHERF
jgi:23S rRNA pseudouridine2604 synthase